MRVAGLGACKGKANNRCLALPGPSREGIPALSLLPLCCSLPVLPLRRPLCCLCVTYVLPLYSLFVAFVLLSPCAPSVLTSLYSSLFASLSICPHIVALPVLPMSWSPANLYLLFVPIARQSA